MEIKTKTIYIGARSVSYDTREEAEVSFVLCEIVEFLREHSGDDYYHYDVNCAASAIVEHREKFIQMLGAIA